MSTVPQQANVTTAWLITIVCAIGLLCSLAMVVIGLHSGLANMWSAGAIFACLYVSAEYCNRWRPATGLYLKPLTLILTSAHCFVCAFATGTSEVQISFFLVSLVIWLLMYHDVLMLRIIGIVHVAVTILTIYLCGGHIAPETWFTQAVFVIVVASFVVASSLTIRSNRAYWRRMAELEEEFARNELSLKRTTAQLADQHEVLKGTSAQLQETVARNAEQVDELKLALAEQSQIAQAASSDLRQPLRNINSFVQLIGRRLDKLGVAAEVGEYLDFVTDGAARMNQMVDDLLRYSESPEPSASVDVDTADTLRSIQRNLSDLFARENGLLTFDADLPTVSGQPTQVLQLFQNLISNGIKFKRPHAAPTCHVACEITDGVACFSVSDNGIGIPASRLKDVFGLFTRLHERGAYEGTGIGLATCRRIVIAAGGEIWAESTEGQGTNFCFTWPLRATPQPARTDRLPSAATVTSPRLEVGVAALG